MNPSALLDVTQNLIQQLEEVSGFPVSVVQDAALENLASLSIASARRPIHLIKFQPGVTSLDYLVAVEASRGIRTFRHRPEKRQRLSGNPKARDALAAELKRKIDLPANKINDLSGMLFSGLILQLLSTPVGILLDYQIYRDYPSLREQQKKSLLNQLEINLKILSAAYTQMLPKVVTEASQAMNAAFAISSGELLHETQYIVPFRALGLEKKGMELLAELPSTDSNDLDDPALITRWATHLGIESWLAWVPPETQSP